MNAPARKVKTHTCSRCGRTGSRQFSITYGKYTCDDYVACAKRCGYVPVPTGSHTGDIRAAITWLQERA